ncbi:aminodeoxychorismate synthase component I [Uliginosibacterium aquaticum]|uniref:Aminodeoxychorismate synthase component I n=1 Tax=Uliginosibacterium aquaticum TaxID=2731212 RepID=A0ABX2ILC0_9RHOO|nr:aminodeoxychorismate synthase component I [Uliginosibacterium aquaticum]NSL55121.1 aminodeoxychorismate synthase component I [Uliginosibacterium aquaticum]
MQQLGASAFALFEDNLAQAPRACLLEGLEQRLLAHHPSELAEFFERLEATQASGRWIALAARYELGSAFEPHLPHRHSSQPLLQAWVFAHRSELSGDALARWWQMQAAALSPQAREAGLLRLEADWDEARHAIACQRILDYIHAGDCYQVNLTFPLRGQIYGHPLALAARLREAQPVAHGVLIHDGKDWIISRSPELFVERHASTLTCRPMKGTATRSEDPQADAAAASRLVHSDKDRAENLMIVDLIRNDLGRLAPAGGVRVEQMFSLETYPSVHQLTSTVSAEPVSAPLETILHALFPCGSITGAPKIRAMQIINELEDGPRGIYCGALGWLAPEGEFSLNVPIRTLLVDSEGTCRLDVGSGVVADSEPAAEYRECLTKGHFLTQLEPPLQLIETLRWTPSEGYPFLNGHLERLQASARTLAFSCPLTEIRAALQALADILPGSAQRVRLLLSRNGQFSLQNAAHAETPATARFALADWALDPQDPRLSHKTTARQFYDSALQSALQRGLFDLVFCNTRGELCEGARSNLFLEIEGEMLTPASHCGLLPGVLRASLLASGKAREAVLQREDLARANRIWLGNALRGLIEVTQAT